MLYFQIDKKIMHSSGMMARVHQEVSIHSKLKHPSILELYTFFEDSCHVYLILEYCENGELQKYLKFHNKILNESEGQFIYYIDCYSLSIENNFIIILIIQPMRLCFRSLMV